MSGRRRLLRDDSDSESSDEHSVTVLSSTRPDAEPLAELRNPVKDELFDLEEERTGGAAARVGPSSNYQSGELKSMDDLYLARQEWYKTLKGCPSMTRSRDVCRLIEVYRIGDIEFKIPETHDRPWRAPAGYFCVYEAYFSFCGLKFPLPSLLVDYCHERRMAISQLTASAIYNFVVLCEMAMVSEVEMDLRFLEEITLLCKCSDYPGAYYLRAKHDIICGAPNKIQDWKRRFFYVKKNEASLSEDSRPVRQDWNSFVARHPVGRPLRATFYRDVEKIRDLSISQHQKIAKTREQRRLAAAAMAGPDGEKGRKRKSSEQTRSEPSKRHPSSSHRTELPSASAGYRSTIDRGLEAKRLADVKRGRSHADQNLLERSRSQAPLVGNRSNRESSTGTSGASPNLSGQGVKSQKMVAKSPLKPVEEKSRAAPEEGESHMAKKIVSSDVIPAAAEKSSSDAGKAAELGDDHPSGEKDGARSLFPPDFAWPDSLSVDQAVCGELVYSVRARGASYPAFESFEVREEYERFARASVRSLMFANEMAVRYEEKLAEARREVEKAKDEAAREVEKAKDEAARAKDEVARAKGQLEGAKTFYARTDKQRREENEKNKDENTRLRALVGRLQDRLQYLKKVEEPSGLATQIRGTVGVVEIIKGMKVDVPQRIIDILHEDLKEYEAKAEAIPRVELDPEDLEALPSSDHS